MEIVLRYHGYNNDNLEQKPGSIKYVLVHPFNYHPENDNQLECHILAVRGLYNIWMRSLAT